MLKRNAQDWLSVLKLLIIPLAAALVFTPIDAQAQWVLIDDFEGLAVDDTIIGTTGPGCMWTGNVPTNSAQVDPDCPTNMAMQVPGEPNPSALRACFTDATTNIASGATGTLFYRFRTPVAADGTTDNVVGLTDSDTLTNFNFKSGLRNRVVAGPDGVTPRNELDLRDGGTYELVAPLADNTWYNFWMVSTNTNPGTHACYLQSDDDPNFATQTLLVSGGDPFDYRINGNTDIINVYFRNANNPGGVAGNSLYFDDIYVNPSESDLTLPEGVGDCGFLKGDVNMDGMIDFFDIQPFIDALSGGQNPPPADIDCNGVVNFFDIQPFIDLLAQ